MPRQYACAPPWMGGSYCEESPDRNESGGTGFAKQLANNSCAVIVCVVACRLAVVKVRIKQTPREGDVDGVRLDDLRPGVVRVVSASVGAWLISQGYADLEMRAQVTDPRAESDDRPHRRSTDR